MPTIEDLHDLLTTRARQAGDPQALRARLHDATRVERPRRPARPVLVLAAVATTAAVAVGAAVLARPGSAPSPRSAPPAASTGAPTTRPATSHAGDLSWLFAMRGVDGYEFGGRTRFAGGQVVLFARAGLDLHQVTGGPRGDIELYDRGVEPDTGSPATVLARGAAVRVGDTVGRYYLGQLVWRWAPDSWAVLSVLQTGLPNGHDGQTQAKYLTLSGAVRRLAEAVHPTPGDTVEVPMTVRGLPSLGLHARGALVDADPAARACVAYDRAQPAGVPLGRQEQLTDDETLWVCRGASPTTDGWLGTGRATTVAGHEGRRYANGISVTLPDGSSLSVQLGEYAGPSGYTTVTRARAITPADQERIIRATDTSPDLHDPSTWVPAGR